VPSSTERDEIKRLRAELRRVEQERDILKKVVTIFAQPPQS
jgi:transposase